MVKKHWIVISQSFASISAVSASFNGNDYRRRFMASTSARRRPKRRRAASNSSNTSLWTEVSALSHSDLNSLAPTLTLTPTLTDTVSPVSQRHAHPHYSMERPTSAPTIAFHHTADTISPHTSPAEETTATPKPTFERRSSGPSILPSLTPTDTPTQDPTWSPVPLVKSPLKVFVIAGQSNAMGKGSIEHLNELIAENCTGGCNEYRDALWNATSDSYKVESNVYEKYLQYHVGELGVFDDYYDDATNESDYYTFGPELMFGWTVQQVLDEPIAIIKTAWGGKSLAVDFRPPSSGLGNYTGVRPTEYGVYYRQMVSEIETSLMDLESWVPCYNPDHGYDLAGFVWFQGYNDLLQWKSVMEYSDNLANLIRDLRSDMGVDGLPFVIGELGMHGDNATLFPEDSFGRIMKMRSSQYLVTTTDEFRNNTLFVRTAPYVVLGGEQFNGVYHYGGRADTFFHIGQAFGRGMLTLLGYNATEPSTCKCEVEGSSS